MSIPDPLITDYFELVTNVPEEEIAESKKQLQTHSVNPMSLKKRLAHEIVRQFHSKRAADAAQEHFTQVFQKREIPEETRTVELRGVSRGVTRLSASLLVEAGLAKSRSEANRLLVQGAIEVDGKKVSTSLVSLKDGSIIKVGKRRFIKIIDADKEKA
jgi:tyrosyl-tRNA synthetase